MRLILVILMLVGACGRALAAAGVPMSVPLPRPRPARAATPPPTADPFAGFDPAAITSAPTPCDRRLAAMATIKLMPRLIGPGACGGYDLVRIDAVVLPDKTKVAIQPAALLTCPMAESLAAWLRDAVAPSLAKQGAHLSGLENEDSYQCRTRNNIPGAKLSEHAHGDAIDVRAFVLADGRRLALTDRHVDKPLRVAWRDSACHRFTTVLGPGEAYHSGHIHLDDIARHDGYRICEWQVLVPAPKPPVPLPRPRPSEAAVPVGRGAPSARGAPAGKGQTF